MRYYDVCIVCVYWFDSELQERIQYSYRNVNGAICWALYFPPGVLLILDNYLTQNFLLMGRRKVQQIVIIQEGTGLKTAQTQYL